MSSEPTTKHATPFEERRRTQRRKVNDLAYVACGSDNGGILLDVGEEGLSFHGIAPLIEGNILEIKFVLPGLTSAIETSGEVVWSTDSKRSGGLRFINLDGSARQQIIQWVSDPGAASLAAPGSETTVPEVPDVPVVPRERANTHPQAPRTMFTDGLRRIDSVAPAPQEVPGEKAREDRPAAAAATPGVVLSGVPEQTSRAMLYVLAGVLGCLLIVAAGLIGFRAEKGADATSAGKGAAPAAPAPSADEANRNFQVEVLDIHNRRLVLSNDPTTSSGSGSVQGQKAGAQSVSAASVTTPLAAPLRTGDAATPRRNLQDLTLKAPSQLNRPAVVAQPQEPAIAGGVPPVASFGTPLVVGESPTQPAPPQTPAVMAPPRSGLQPAVLIKRVEPTYSVVARQARASGAVQVSATIGTDGVPRALHFVKGDARLAPSALEAIRQWRYRPALLDGQAIETDVLVQVEFKLPQ